jgi:hypothetical protein
MRFISMAFIGILFFLGCKEKKVDLSGETKVKSNDFFAAFPIIQTPYTVADTNLNKRTDTVRIGEKAMLQFIPDSVISIILNNNKKVNIYSIGKIVKENEVYLLAKFAFNKNSSLYCFVFDKKNKFLSYKHFLNTNNSDDYVHLLSINREPTFTISKEKMNEDKQQLQYSRIGWAFNMESNGFYTVVTETNEDEKKNNTILNPIDTLPRKNKLSGNYVKDNKNFISLRDGKNNAAYLFFIHFEKNNGNCIGELKGELQMKTPTKGIYSENGDVCVIDFTFSGSELIVKEQGSCGNHRGIKCFFDDSFIRKKELVIKKKRK